jgi:hypothetical protein
MVTGRSSDSSVATSRPICSSPEKLAALFSASSFSGGSAGGEIDKELVDLILFLAHVAPFYLDDLVDLPNVAKGGLIMSQPSQRPSDRATFRLQRVASDRTLLHNLLYS